MALVYQRQVGGPRPLASGNTQFNIDNNLFEKRINRAKLALTCHFTDYTNVKKTTKENRRAKAPRVRPKKKTKLTQNFQ